MDQHASEIKIYYYYYFFFLIIIIIIIIIIITKCIAIATLPVEVYYDLDWPSFKCSAQDNYWDAIVILNLCASWLDSRQGKRTWVSKR